MAADAHRAVPHFNPACDPEIYRNRAIDLAEAYAAGAPWRLGGGSAGLGGRPARARPLGRVLLQPQPLHVPGAQGPEAHGSRVLAAHTD